MGPGAHARRVGGGWLVAAATALVLLGGSILVFLNPIYVSFEQGRAGAAALTGYTTPELDAVTGRILGDLVLWQGGFEETVAGAPVLKPGEIQHMRDVRGVFAGFYLLVAAAALVLVAAFRRARGAAARAETWGSVAAGARGLAVGVVAAGVFALVAFDAAFELFHRLFFSAGSYSFDPRTDKLVQLFPESFWSETTTFVAVTVLVAAAVTWSIARARARRLRASAEGRR